MTDFDIKIKTPADLAGAEKTVEGLGEVKQGATQAAEALDKVAESASSIGKDDGSKEVVPSLRDLVQQATAAERQAAALNDALLKASPAALEQIRASLEEYIAKAKAAGQATAELDDQLNQVTYAQQAQAEAAKEMSGANDEAKASMLDTASTAGTVTSAVLDVTKSVKGGTLVFKALGAFLKGDLKSVISATMLMIKGLRALLITSPFGIWIAGITAAVAAFTYFNKKSKETEEANAKLAKSFEDPEQRVASLVAEIQKVNQARLDEAITAAKKLGDEYARSTNELKELRRIEDQRTDAKMASDIAQNDLAREKELAGAVGSPEKQEEIRLKYARKELEIRQGFEKKQAEEKIRRAAQDIDQNSAAQRKLKEGIQDANNPAVQAQADVEATRKRLAELGRKSDQQIRRDKLAELESGRANMDATTTEGAQNIELMRRLKAMRSLGGLDGDTTFNSERERLQKAKEEAEQRLKDAQSGSILNPYDPAKEKAAIQNLANVREAIDLLDKLPKQEEAAAKAATDAAAQIETLNQKLKELTEQTSSLRAALDLAKAEKQTTAVKQESQIVTQTAEEETAKVKRDAAQKAEQKEERIRKLENDARVAENKGDLDKAARLRIEADKARLPDKATSEQKRAFELDAAERIEKSRKETDEAAKKAAAAAQGRIPGLAPTAGPARPDESNYDYQRRRAGADAQNAKLQEFNQSLEDAKDGFSPEEMARTIELLNQLGPAMSEQFKTLRAAIEQALAQIKNSGAR